jgi:hypothetical protein
MKEQEILNLVKEAAYEMTVEEGMEKLGWNPLKYLKIGGGQLKSLATLGKKQGLGSIFNTIGRTVKNKGFSSIAPAAAVLGTGAAGIGAAGYGASRLLGGGNRRRGY